MKKLGFVALFIFGLFVGNICSAGFPAGTGVKMADGSIEKIETIKPGEILFGGGIVEKVVLTTTDKLVVLQLFEKTIKTTADQCFFIVGGYSSHGDSVMKCENLSVGYWIKCLPYPPTPDFPEKEFSDRISEKWQEVCKDKIIIYGLKIEDNGKGKGYYFADDLKAASE